ncbi:MAG: toprim domain-containing protein [Thermoguttaceae bacterium]|nr:toprim domain-containing protein [Thermoguttaceae bacterium]
MEDPEAEPARLYISQRGISDAMVSQFRIGYAPRNTGRLMNLIKADRNRVAILEAGGVLVHKDNEESRFDEQTQTLSESEQREYYDRFYGRVIFPIRNLQGNTVSFGGRRLSDEPSRTTGKPPAKYVNGEGTIAFSKRKTIFGLDFAVNEIRARKRAEKTDRVVITEGYTDVIMAHQCGFRETVAIMGTALGLDHIRELKRHTNRMILVLDGDKPGRAKAQAALPLFVSQGVDLRILTLPDNADPCEYLLNHGAEAFEDQLEICSLDAMEHALREAIGNLDVDRDVIGSSRALDSLLAIIAKAPTGTAVIGDPVHLRMEKMIQRIATRFHVEEKRVRFELGEHRRRLKEQPDVMLRYSESEDVSEPVPETNDRQLYVYPIASSEDETEESLQTKYAKFPNSVWSNRHLLPASPETDYLELWLTRPELLEELARRINSSQLCSPVSRQLDLLGRDMMSHGILPEFQKIMLRYDDERMKKYLVFLDESAAMKNLPERLGDEHERDGLVEQIVAAFERKQIATARTRLVSDLRESTFSSEEKLQQLRELELLLRRRQEALSGGTDVMDDDGPRG